MATITKQGLTDIREVDGSPAYTLSADRVVMQRKFEGPWSQFEEPPRPTLIGSRMVGLLPEWIIVGLTQVCEQRDGKGVVTYELESLYNAGWNEPGYGDHTIYDIEWVALEKDLLVNALYQSGGAKALTEQDLVDLGRWRNNGPVDNTAGKFKYFYDSGGTDVEVTLSANATDAATLLLAGVSGYRTWYPVISGESYYLTAPPAWKGGVIENPPAIADTTNTIIPHYIWQRAACRRRFERNRWTQRKEWIGADAIYTALYPAS